MSQQDRPLAHARVALLYGPGNMAADYASALVRGIERGLLELGADVATLNLAFFKRHMRSGSLIFDDESPYVRGIKRFLNDTAGARGFDYCLGMFYDQYLTVGLQECLRQHCRVVINYPLNLLDQPTFFEKALQFCDITFCSEEGALASLRARHGDRRVRYVPMAADPFIHRPIARPERPRLLFVGSLYADRPLLLERCADIIDLSIYGPRYDAVKVLGTFAREFAHRRRLNGIGYAARALARAARRDSRIVSDEEFVRLASEHGVSIGFSSVRQEHTKKVLYKVRLRDYESTMCGLCHLAKRLPELERGFVESEEILFYDTDNEILEILGRVRKGEIDWAGIGKRARARAERDHTWTRRLRGAFSQE